MSKTIDELKMAFEKANENHMAALTHSYSMSEQMAHHEMRYEEEKLSMGPIYWERYTKFREAEANYTAAKEAEKVAEEALNVAEQALQDAEEVEYFATLKCTFCGELNSVCGGDHSEEMYWLSQPRY